MAAAAAAILAVSIFLLSVQARPARGRPYPQTQALLDERWLLQAPSLLQTKATAKSSRSVPSDFFEDASVTTARTGGETGATAPFDVGNGAVPLPNSLESPHPWKLPEDTPLVSLPKSAGVLSLAAARTSTGTAPAAGARPALDDVNEDASPKRLQQASQRLQEQQQALLQQQRQLQHQMQREEAQQQERTELLREQQEQRIALQQEELAKQQQKQQQARQQEAQERQLDLQRKRAQQQEALQRQRAMLQQQQHARRLAMPEVSANKVDDPVAEATSFFEAQGDLAGKDPVGLSEAAAAALAPAAPSQPASAAPRAAAARQGGAAVEQELKHLQQQQRYLEMLQQSLLQNMTASQAPLMQPAVSQLSAAATRAAALPQQGEVEFMPKHEDCTPHCSYKCTNPTCEQECSPQCDSPRCQTRCSGTELSGCRMQCGQPHCSVVCPSKMCSGPDCQPCTTKCSEPMCMLQCPKAQPCQNVCQQPRCLWKCKAPSACPKPKCDMVCESPSKCAGSTFKELPPLKPGEVSVMSFAAPAELISTGAAQTPTQAPVLAQTRSSFLEPSALRGYAAAQSSTSHVHVPVEYMPDDASTQFMPEWQARAVGQDAASLTQSLQRTARMPVSYAPQPSQGYSSASESYSSLLNSLTPEETDAYTAVASS